MEIATNDVPTGHEAVGAHRPAVDLRHASALEHAAESIIITRADGRIDHVNAAFERMTGYRRDELIGLNPRILQSGAHDAAFYQAMWTRLGAGDPWAATFVNRRKDGSLYHQHTSISAVRDREGVIIGYVGIARDMDPELALQERLAQSLHYTQTVADTSTVAILTYKASGQAISANRAAAAMKGGTVEQLRAQNFRELASWRTAGLIEAAEAALASGREQRVEARMTTTFGRELAVIADFVPFEFEGEPQLLAMLTDITERKRVEAQFLQAQKMEAVGLLAGGVAHDFNNVLAVIMSFGEFAREGLDPSDQRYADLTEVLTAAERAAGLTKQLLIFSRQQPTQKRPTNLNRNVTDLQKFLARAVGDNIKLTVSLAPAPVVVAIDPVQFDQVLLNLAVNARDAMSGGGGLQIALCQVDDVGSTGAAPMARLTVTDSGTGMDEETKKRVFEPFFTTKERGKGTGLGLATCFGIVKDAGGSIHVTSTRGKGTTITVDLPLCKDSIAPDGARTLELARGQGELILVVEDDAVLRSGTTRVLENAGYRVIAAPDGNEACRRVEELGSDLDAVLTDVMLPGRSGPEIAQLTAQVSPGTAVILISGFPEELAGGAIDPGVPVLWKPIRPDALVRAVAGALARSVDAVPSPRTIVAQESLPVDLARERVLLVEDDVALARVSRRVLEVEGLEVVVAHSLAMARAAVGGTDFDAIVCDIGLPDGSGLDLLRELREHERQLPVVMMTGAPSVETATIAVRGQVAEYLQKPIPAGELRRAVRAAVDGGRIARLRTKLLAAKFGNSQLLHDLPTTERTFASALSTLHMVYQPIVRARSGEIFAHEALVRTAHPVMGSPGQLLAAAEALGRIEDVGRSVRAAVASGLRHHGDALGIAFVNVHPLEFREDILADLTDPLLGFADRVVIEVTERASLETGPTLDRTLLTLRDHGYKIAVDDLGEGYAGLASLISLRPEFAKIDMSLVRGVDRSAIQRDIIAAVVDIGRRSNFMVIAEGVERTEERDVLAELGCDLLQGYLFGRPTQLAG
jgi:PAS domain S-box-containing protein